MDSFEKEKFDGMLTKTKIKGEKQMGLGKNEKEKKMGWTFLILFFPCALPWIKDVLYRNSLNIYIHIWSGENPQLQCVIALIIFSFFSSHPSLCFQCTWQNLQVNMPDRYVDKREKKKKQNVTGQRSNANKSTRWKWTSTIFQPL